LNTEYSWTYDLIKAVFVIPIKAICSATMWEIWLSGCYYGAINHFMSQNRILKRSQMYIERNFVQAIPKRIKASIIWKLNLVIIYFFRVN